MPACSITAARAERSGGEPSLAIQGMSRPCRRGKPVARTAHSKQPVEAAPQQFVDRQPMGRLGGPQEVAMLAVCLASDESAFATGQIHLVDGGFAL